MDEYRFYDAHEPPFTLHGLVSEPEYNRLPASLRKTVRPPVADLSTKTAGGRIRFRTDAASAVIRITLADNALKTHMTPLNMAGAELYAGSLHSFRRIAVLRPQAEGDVPFEKLDGYSIRKLSEHSVTLRGEWETYTLYLPTFAHVTEIRIGLPEGAGLTEAEPYRVEKPVVFYGSSITQGACAGRPSLSYPALACAELDADFINLGFAGNALGEQELAEYIARLDMSIFVLDYDHNAPDTDWLRRTHEPFYRTVRRDHPELPVVILSRPPLTPARADTDERFAVIEETCRRAREREEPVWLIDGRTFFPEEEADRCLMDFTHPNDYGFHLMAEKILPVLKEIIG